MAIIKKWINKIIGGNLKEFEHSDFMKPKFNEIKNSGDCKTDVKYKIAMFFENQFSVEAKKKKYDKEWMLHYCINKAWIDATISERFKKDSEIIKNKKEIICFLENQILNNQCEICDNFYQWHNSICERSVHNMRYGVWQKLINMTFKYLYCIESVFPEYSDVWCSCHCPIDTIISKQIYNKLKEKNIAAPELIISKKISKSDRDINWNNITKDDYLKLQNQIRLICKDLDICPIEFDFLYWEK